MSDFLTNLVIRSFSPARSFQPMVANTTAAEPAYEAAPVHAEPEQASISTSIKLPDVITNAPVQKTNVVNDVTHHPAQASINAPVIVNAPPALIPILPSIPEKFDSRKPIAQKPIETPRTKTRKAEPPIVEQVTEHVTEQVIERPSVTVQNHHQITKHQTRHHHVTNSEIANHEINNHEVTNQQVTKREITNREITNRDVKNYDITNHEISTSFTTLSPKPTAQPLPPVNVTTRPTSPAVQPRHHEPDPAPVPPETVINVAIGRIEVRATPATNPRRERQSPAPKVMTLDDYVQQRSRGAK